MMARALDALGAALQSLPCALPLLQRKGVVSLVRRMAAAHAASLERRRSPTQHSPAPAQRSGLLIKRLAGTSASGTPPRIESAVGPG